MKSPSEMTLRELVDVLYRGNNETYATPYFEELERRLPEIEAAVSHAEESGFHSETCSCVCCELLFAYRAAREARRGDASVPLSTDTLSGYTEPS